MGERKSAQEALNRLVVTGIPRTVVAISYQIRHAPTLCSVIRAGNDDGLFKLWVAWQPTGSQYRTASQSVLEATIGGLPAKDVSFRVTSFGGGLPPEPPGLKADLVRAMLTRPAERCEVFDDGSMQLASAQ